MSAYPIAELGQVYIIKANLTVQAVRMLRHYEHACTGCVNWDETAIRAKRADCNDFPSCTQNDLIFMDVNKIDEYRVQYVAAKLTNGRV